MARPEGYTLEDEGAKRKWDAWKNEEGLPRTEAKRRYISCLIDTMRVYASGTVEARELLGELEYLWDQIKDVAFSDTDSHYGRRGYSVLESDRYSTGTPWPIQSSYAALVTALGARSNLERIYLHSRRPGAIPGPVQGLGQQGTIQSQGIPNQAIPSQAIPGQAIQAQGQGRGQSVLGHAVLARPGSHGEGELRAWQNEINTIVNKLSKDYVERRRDSEPGEPQDRLRRRIVGILRTVGWQVLHAAKSVLASLVALLFVVWCLKKNVRVERTVARHPRKELVINMTLNPDENKWFVRMLVLLNKFVGFV